MMQAELAQPHLSAERRFYLFFTITITAAIMLGFARTFLLRPLFPEWVHGHAPREPFFYFHGLIFFSWVVLLLVQTSLIAARRVDVHRKLGLFVVGLAGAMLVVGTIAALIAAGRRTGFIDVTLPPLQFLVVPLTDLALFGTFTTFGFITRRKLQSHKRWMLLASIGLLDAGIARWPFAIMTATLPFPGFTVVDIGVDLFLIPLIAWDLISQRRVHPVTLCGGLILIVSQPLRFVVASTHAWLSLSGWAVGLLQH